MYRIALINMPFSSMSTPSIALAQLSTVVNDRLAGEVEITTFHLNLDFVPFLGKDLYEIVSDSVQANTSGLGDWFFKLAAFPGMADDPDAYLRRHFAEDRARLAVLGTQLLSRRPVAGAFLDRLVDKYGLHRFDMAAFTSMFSQNVAAFSMARRLKARNPGLVTVIGGANCEGSMGVVIARNVEWMDWVVSGPALKTFPRLVAGLLAGRPEECRSIRGVLWRDKPAAAAGQPPELGEELDIDVEVPLDYDDYFAQVAAKLPGIALQPQVPFETSRGCWWGERSHCTFCGLNGATMKYRAMSGGRAVALLNGLFDRYAPQAADFSSVDNILPREYLTEVLPRLRAPDGVSLFYEVKADLKEHEMLALADARVTRIQPGIEALSTSTLKLMGKGTTSFQNLRFLKDCLRMGISPAWNLLVGFPREPEAVYEKYERDLPSLVHLHPPSGAFPVRFDRFSPYFNRAREYGLDLRACDFYSMVYPFSAADLEEMAYFFVDGNYNAEYLRNSAKWLGKLRECIDSWRRRWARQDGLLKPALDWRWLDGERAIYDSRAGVAVWYTPTAGEAAVLDALEQRHRIPQLAAKLAGRLSGPQVEECIARLQQRRLLFAEDDFFLTLVVDPPPAAAAFAAAAGAGADLQAPAA